MFLLSWQFAFDKFAAKTLCEFLHFDILHFSKYFVMHKNIFSYHYPLHVNQNAGFSVHTLIDHISASRLDVGYSVVSPYLWHLCIYSS